MDKVIQAGQALPQRVVGSFLASCGLTVKGQAGPTGNELKTKIKTKKEGQAQTPEPAQEARPPQPCSSPLILLPQHLTPQEKADFENQQEGTSWSLPFSYALDK